MITLILPFLTSVGALLFEFSLSHFLSISLGDSSFGFAFVIGVFLFFMGLGAFSSERWSPLKTRPGSTLIAVELALTLLCLIALPALSLSSGALRAWELSAASCRSLLCTRVGLGLVAETGLWLALTGWLVGMEIPLFLRFFGAEAGRVLAADYFGAFAAGIAFPLVMLPRWGTLGTLLFGAALHLTTAFLLSLRERRQARTWLALGLLGLAWLGMASKLSLIEEWLLEQVLTDPEARETQVLLYHRTRKQSVAITTSELPDGQRDTRLYLEGYLQFSSGWNLETYHRQMTQPARALLPQKSARVLVLGGGDGLLARAIKENHPDDHVLVVDFDCELLALAHAPGPLHELAAGAWERPGVDSRCADAFWFVRQREQRRRWDLVLVDFPHGVGDAAAERVESFEFFRDLHGLLNKGGVAVLQHEHYASAAQACVEETLREAGFDTRALPVGEDLDSSEAMILGLKADFHPESVDPRQAQTFLRTRCSRMGPFGRILWGA